MANQAGTIKALEEASQKHEKEIVIDFASDRILHYIGVYLIAFLAVLAKISELAGANLSCYSFGNTTVRADFITYATSYCWETSKVTAPGEIFQSTCSNHSTFSGTTLLNDPALFKALIQWTPYAMLFEAFLFSVPLVCWHYTVGGRLMGHLKFMQQILGDMYEKVKKIQGAMYYENDSYDSDSYYLDGMHGFKPNYSKKTQQQKRDEKEKQKSKRNGCCPGLFNWRTRENDEGSVDTEAGDPPKDNVNPGRGQKADDDEADKTKEHKQTNPRIQKKTQQEKREEKEKQESKRNGCCPELFNLCRRENDERSVDTEAGDPSNDNVNPDRGQKATDDEADKTDVTKEHKQDGSVFGGMCDRHLFSMLCFENFSSLEYIPYILTMYKLSQVAVPEGKEYDSETLPKIKGILRLICHDDNFGGRFLVRRYIAKHVFGTFVSIALLITTGIILHTLGAQGWDAENFRCDMAYHMDVCMVCTIRRKRDMIAYLAVNLLVNVMCLGLSINQLYRILERPDKNATSNYFEEIRVYGSVALD